MTDFWSIGHKTAAKLDDWVFIPCLILAHADRQQLKRKFGVLGDALYFHSWGIDYSDLTKRYVPRSDNRGYGNSQVLMRDYTTREDIETVLFEIADQVATRLRKHDVLGEVIGISVGFATPDEHNRHGWSAQTKVDPTNATNDLIRAVQYLFESRWQGNALRNLGVRVNRISKPSTFQLSLFEDNDRHTANLRWNMPSTRFGPGTAIAQSFGGIARSQPEQRLSAQVYWAGTKLDWKVNHDVSRI
ncbi:putative UV-damage repair protein UvrX [Lactiplantibacillus plantarum subsp. plantarum]|uniref:Putative UV-damage repair protein UvrX n=1 Tax=Lactiplantibacillus plantarum subsp. plantarum TaxID=337330 RepID=A0A2S3U935_LACPN|nr:putative UV-damage repair protein UvrX [Lactiplantibacillus plantarum subsp. plantarum]